MTDRRTERVAGYMRHEHANSYAVETGGLKELVFGNKRGQSRQELTEALSELQDRVQTLEHMLGTHIIIINKLTENLQEQVDKNKADHTDEVSKLHERVREMKVEHNKLSVRVLGPLTHELQELQQFVKEQRAFNKQSAGAIDAMSALILKNIR